MDYRIAHKASTLDWISSGIDSWKVNFDGASFGNPGSAGFGCVMRDSQGQILRVKGGPLGIQDAIFAETMGLLEDLKLAKSKGATKCIIIEGDSLTIISWGSRHNGGSWRLNHILSLIKALIKELGAELIHVSRSQNSLVDKVAKWSVGQSHLFEGDCILD